MSGWSVLVNVASDIVSDNIVYYVRIDPGRSDLGISTAGWVRVQKSDPCPTL